MRRARFSAGYPSAEAEAEGRDDFEAWLAEHTSYSAACRWAATDRGLDLISTALCDAGIGHSVGQCTWPPPDGRALDRNRLRQGRDHRLGHVHPDVIALFIGHLAPTAESDTAETVVQAVNTAVDSREKSTCPREL